MKNLKIILFGLILFLSMRAQSQNLDSLKKAMPLEKDLYVKVDVAPQFKGGDKELTQFLASTLRYPLKAMANHVQGIVHVAFIVEVDGKLSALQILKSPNIDLSKESLRVMRISPSWKPGIKDGKPVRVLHTIPVSFKLD